MPAPAARRRPPFRERIASWVPFGLGQRKPHHFLEMGRIVWANRDNLGHAWRVLSRGVCDGCALGTSGLKDWTIEGTHLCLVRLNLLRLNTMGPLDDALTADVAALSRLDDRALRDLGRLGSPLRRRRGERGFTRVSWDEALADIGARWRALDPARTAMYVTSRGVTNEVYYAAQKVMRALGSNNVDNSARLCHSPSTSGLKATVGVAATTCSYKDWFEADLIVFLGSNVANDQPVATKFLVQARKGGTRTVMINPYREPGMERYWVPSDTESALFGSRLCDRFVQVRTGGDLALLNALAKRLLERDAAAGGDASRSPVAREFLDAAVDGLPAFREELAAQPLERLAELAGVPVAEIDALADEVAAADKTIWVWSMGITQHAHGGDTVRAIANLALLREHVGRPGTGLMPIRGHSGVQGGAEMGAYATAFPGGVAIDAASAARLSQAWGFPVPDAPGLTTTEWIAAAGRGELDAVYSIGGNFLSTLPRPELVAQALSRIGLRVHTDIVLSSQMLVEPGDTVYVLPSRTRYEQEGGGTETSTERRVIFSPEIPGHAVGEARSEWRILADFGRAVRPELSEKLGLTSGAAIRQEIGALVPDYAPIGKLAAQGDQFQWGGPHLCAGRRFPTKNGRAQLVPVRPPGLGAVAGRPHSVSAPEEGPGPPREFILATRRGKQFNSMVQADLDPLNGARRSDVLIAPADAAALGLSHGDRLRLTSAFGSYEGRAFLADVARGTLQGHWPEVNVLIGDGVVEPGGGVPDYNARVSVSRA